MGAELQTKLRPFALVPRTTMRVPDKVPQIEGLLPKQSPGEAAAKPGLLGLGFCVREGDDSLHAPHGKHHSRASLSQGGAELPKDI